MKPIVPSRSEQKAQATARIAKMIIENEASKRDANTERLRSARLARDLDINSTLPTIRAIPPKRSRPRTRGTATLGLGGPRAEERPAKLGAAGRSG